MQTAKAQGGMHRLALYRETEEGSDKGPEIRPCWITAHGRLFPYISNDPKFSDRQAWANSADPDQTAPRGAV